MEETEISSAAAPTFEYLQLRALHIDFDGTGRYSPQLQDGVQRHLGERFPYGGSPKCLVESGKSYENG